MKLLFGTSNRGKHRELGQIFSEHGLSYELVSPGDVGLELDVVEDLPTFEGNATKKALAYARASGLLTLADDSGLEVDALGGAPGVISARYASENATDDENNRKLLRELSDKSVRRARFRCVLVLARADSVLHVCAGACEGEIAAAPRGAGGFGYDPLFVPAEGAGGTMAELEPKAKNALSHRGRAARMLASWLAHNSP